MFRKIRAPSGVLSYYPDIWLSFADLYGSMKAWFFYSFFMYVEVRKIEGGVLYICDHLRDDPGLLLNRDTVLVR